MSWRSWILWVAWLLSACGRVGFSPLDEEPPADQGSGGSAQAGETCATAQLVEPEENVVIKSTFGAREDVPSSAGCEDGPELVLRFSESASGFPLRIEADFSGYYAIGRGCPLSSSQTRLCGTFSDSQSQVLSLDVTADTYVILSNAPGAAGLVELWLGDPDP